MKQLNIHNYRTRQVRHALAWVAACVGLVGVIGLASANADRFTCDPEPHTVQYGDTLWAIAQAKCDGNIQAVTDNLVNTYGTTIQAGWQIWLPTSNDCRLELRNGEVWESC
jgi:hypothetical protein